MEKKAPQISRRGFLTLLGVSGAGVAAGGLSGCDETGIANFLQLAEPEVRAPKGPEKWITTICGQCDAGCSIRVRTIGERAVNLTGNPLYPLNGNGVCPRGLAGLQALYNPDRIQGPLMRVGERGQAKWREITWSEALQTVARRLKQIRDRGDAHRFVFLSRESGGLMGSLIARFCSAYGTPNDIREVQSAVVTQSLSRYCAQGTYGPLAYDFDNTNYILSFGTPLLDDYASTVRMLRTYGHLRQERPGPKAKIIQVDPRLSVTAARADEWIPINPGTEGALALGIAYVLIREGLYNKQFVDRYTFGFDDWREDNGEQHIGFKTLVLSEFNLDRVTQITGTPVSRILEVAHEFANAKPAIALGETHQTNSVYSLFAVHALNALIGSIDVPGGVVFPQDVPLKALAAVEPDDAAARALKQPRLDRAAGREFPLARDLIPQLIKAAAGGSPYKPEALFLHYSNPIFSLPQAEQVVAALKQIPFIVSFSPCMDETTAYADVVLPDHTYFERWQDVAPPATGPYRFLGLRQPVVQPLHNTMSSGDALIKIAQSIGAAMAQAFPWPDFVTVLRETMSGVYEARAGAIVEQFAGEKSWTTVLEERGWWYASYKSFDEFWGQMQEKGGWWDPMYNFGERHRVFQNPSGTFEFYSLTLREKLGKPDDIACMPHYEQPTFKGGESEFPFHLNIVRLMPQAHQRDANLPFLQEILGPHLAMRWDSWAEINPESARRLGIADGDLVWVESPAGKLKVVARWYAGAMPNVINLPANMGHDAYGRWAKGIGVNPMEIVVQELDSLAGTQALQATRVRIYKA